MNVTQILANAANAINLLAVAGVKIPPTLINTVSTALPAVEAIQSVVANPPTNINSAVSDLATVAGAVQATGLASADSEISAIIKEVDSYAASLKNFESGQVVTIAQPTVSINGEAKKAHLVLFLDGGPAAQSLGL